MKPKIGITLDWEKKGSFSNFPYYCLREHYFNAVYAVGGIPIALTYIADAIDDYLDLIDGLIVPGGTFASPNDWYINHDSRYEYKISPRMQFDIAIIKKALARNMPLLGICAGMQFLAGINDCKLTRNIHKTITTDINHWDAKPANEYVHDTNIVKNTKLFEIIKHDNIHINSHHREAVMTIPDHVTVNAIASDGTIEGIELDDYKFAIGVQWHPEFLIAKDSASLNLFKALISASKNP